MSGAGTHPDETASAFVYFRRFVITFFRRTSKASQSQPEGGGGWWGYRIEWRDDDQLKTG